MYACTYSSDVSAKKLSLMGAGRKKLSVLGTSGDHLGPLGTIWDQNIPKILFPILVQNKYPKTHFSEMARKPTCQKWVLHNLTYTKDTHRL